MQSYQRKMLLERIERDGATVGASIPEAIELDGEPFELRSFVFEAKRAETVPSSLRAEVDEVKKLLRRARLERKRRIEDGEVAWEEGEKLAAEIVGIDRALNALERLGSADLEAESRAQKAADEKRWVRFLRQALGRDSDSNRRRVG